jgi:hypothetical protein
MPPEQLKPKDRDVPTIYHGKQIDCNRLFRRLCVFRLNGHGFSHAGEAETPSLSDRGAASVVRRCPSLLGWWGRGLFVLDFDEQESGSDLCNLDTRGQIDLILGEQKVVDPFSHLCEAHASTHRT